MQDIKIKKNLNLEEEITRNKKIEKKIFITKILLQVFYFLVSGGVVAVCLQLIEKYQVFSAFNVNWTFSGRHFQIVMMWILAILAIYFILQYLSCKKYLVSREEMQRKGCTYSNHYLLQLKTLEDKEVMDYYLDETHPDILCIDYKVDEDLIKRIQMQMNVYYRLSIDEMQIDFDKRQVTLPYR